MSRPWCEKYPLSSLRGDGDDERFEAFCFWQSAARRRRPAPDRDGPEVDRRHRAKQLALARRAARRQRRDLADPALVAEPTGVVREPSSGHHHSQPSGRDWRRTGEQRQAERTEQRRRRTADDGHQAKQPRQHGDGHRSASQSRDGETRRMRSRRRNAHPADGSQQRTDERRQAARPEPLDPWTGRPHPSPRRQP